MLTAKDGGEYDQTDAFPGADDYVTKPFHTSVLAARLSALTRAAPGRPAELAVGDLVLNPATHRVYRGSDEITLTAREFALLQHFMRHPEVVLSKTTLLEEVDYHRCRQRGRGLRRLPAQEDRRALRRHLAGDGCGSGLSTGAGEPGAVRPPRCTRPEVGSSVGA